MDAPVFHAIADPTRRDLLLNLAQNSPKTATQLAQEYPITRQGVLKHLDILENAGLVVVKQQGREKRYTFTPAPLSDLERWMNDLSAIWDTRLLRLKALVESGNENNDNAEG
jgi:DNA-binding transcriptional ArsR family regulator